NRGIPLVKKGGTLILTHPCMDEFDPVQHPSYIEFFHRLLPETTDAMELHHKYEREFAQNPSYVHLYRKGNAYHGAHPFYMWYWGENGRAHLGQVIAVGTENQHVPKLLGWERADTLAEAIDMARGRQGRPPHASRPLSGDRTHPRAGSPARRGQRRGSVLRPRHRHGAVPASARASRRSVRGVPARKVPADGGRRQRVAARNSRGGDRG